MAGDEGRWERARRESEAAQWRLVRWYLAAMGVVVGLAVLVVWLILR